MLVVCLLLSLLSLLSLPLARSQSSAIDPDDLVLGDSDDDNETVAEVCTAEHAAGRQQSHSTYLRVDARLAYSRANFGGGFAVRVV